MYKKSQRQKVDYQKNKINLMMKASNNTKASVYYYVIDQY